METPAERAPIDVPATAGGAPARPAADRRPRRWVWAVVGVLAAAILIGSAVAVQMSASRAFDAAEESLRASLAAVADADATLEAAADDAGEPLESAGQILEAAAGGLVDPAARDAFSAATEAARGAVLEAERVNEAPVDAWIGPAPRWPWELWRGAAELDERSRALTALERDLDDAGDALGSARDAMSAAAVSLYGSVPAAAASLESASVSARTTVVLDFRDAAATAATQQEVGSSAALALALYALQAEVMASSAAAELAEKSGAFFETRLEIEAYARSIAGGVLLDFDWAEVVAGVGGVRGIGGMASWDSDRGGFSTITLSNSVAWEWPSADSQALVAHEVGHAITAKCHHLFDSADRLANEEWATAWAIGVGHTDDANGTQSYGYPSQAMIDIAATCR